MHRGGEPSGAGADPGFEDASGAGEQLMRDGMRLERWRQRARELRGEVHALYLAIRHPGTPWHAKVLAALVVGYAFSPIDLIPDPIPVLGYLDDLVLLPLGILLALRLIPAPVWEECRARAREEATSERPRSWIAAVLIVALWLLLFGLAARWAWRHWKPAA